MDSDRSRSPTMSTAAESDSAASFARLIQDMDEIKQAIGDYLDAAADGSFATLGSLSDAVNPGLLIIAAGPLSRKTLTPCRPQDLVEQRYRILGQRHSSAQRAFCDGFSPRKVGVGP